MAVSVRRAGWKLWGGRDQEPSGAVPDRLSVSARLPANARKTLSRRTGHGRKGSRATRPGRDVHSPDSDAPGARQKYLTSSPASITGAVFSGLRRLKSSCPPRSCTAFADNGGRPRKQGHRAQPGFRFRAGGLASDTVARPAADGPAGPWSSGRPRATDSETCRESLPPCPCRHRPVAVTRAYSWTASFGAYPSFPCRALIYTKLSLLS